MKKHIMKWAGLLSGALCVLSFSPTTEAASIDGSVGFTGTAVFDNTDLKQATAITGYGYAIVMSVGTDAGHDSYASVPLFTAVTFSPFTFSSTPQTIPSLWKFTVGSGSSAVTYSFDANLLTATYNPGTGGSDGWAFSGLGTAHITGYTDTEGSWQFTAGRSGTVFTFQSTATVPPPSVPDGGTTVALLGFALIGIETLRRRALK